MTPQGRKDFGCLVAAAAGAGILAVVYFTATYLIAVALNWL